MSDVLLTQIDGASEAGDAALITVTDAAQATILAARSGEINPDQLALWLEARRVGGRFSYDMFLQAVSDAKPGDVVIEGALPIVVPVASVGLVRGATLDVAADGSGGMVLLNPNEPATPAPGAPPPGDLSSPLAQRVQDVLERQINPQIAAHGGVAQLVSVDGDTAYLRLGGGCQGCAGSKATLKQGIEVSIREAVPEILHIVDVTDHAGGASPYYS